MTDQLILANHTQLKRHARNMRCKYPLADVRRMAVSQIERARRGETPCVQPLVVTAGVGVVYDPVKHHEFTIVAGHLRHAGNAYLKSKSPPLNCLVRYYASEAEMLADMGAENGVRADPGPLSWANYFRNQLATGVKMHQLVRSTGQSLNRIAALLDLAQLTPGAQALVDSGKLALGAVKHLMRITDTDAQNRLARKLAESGATLAQVEMAVKAYERRAGSPARAARAPRRNVATSRVDAPALVNAHANHKATLGDLRKRAHAICDRCEVGRELPHAEPAWHIAMSVAGDVCRRCGLREFDAVCKSCPLAEMMSGMAKMTTATAIEVNAQTGPLGLAQQLRTSERAVFLSEDEKSLVQVGQHVLVINRLSPYQSWLEFMPLIRRGFEAYQAVVDATKFRRIGLRYINQIPFPTETVPLNEFFDFRPFLGPRLTGIMTGFAQEVQFTREDGRDAIRIQIGTNAVGGQAIILDIDYWLVKSELLSLTHTFDWIETAHGQVEDAFEACITDQLRQRFELIQQ